MTWTYVMEETELPEGGMAPVYPLGVAVVVARVGGALHAVSGKCAHMACPLLGGVLDGHTITLPPRTGALLRNAGLLMQHIRTESIRTYEAKAELEWVLVAL